MTSPETPVTDEQIAEWKRKHLWGRVRVDALAVIGLLGSLTDRVRAEREGRLRAEAQVRALEEALGEALEASREPRAEKAQEARGNAPHDAGGFRGEGTVERAGGLEVPPAAPDSGGGS